MEAKIDNLKKFAPLVLRFGLAFVFIWFGMHQLQNPDMWASYIPQFLGLSAVASSKLVLINGLFEIIGAVLLILGAYTRLVALLLALHLFGIAFSIGFTAVGIRDIGLSFATLSLALYGAGKWAIDKE